MSGTSELTLEDRLERAHRDLACAEAIENWARSQRETQECQRRIASIKAQIAERDERLHVEAAVMSLGDRHAS